MKIGFACKLVFENKQLVKEYNTKSTTIKHLSTMSFSKQMEKIHEIVDHNLSALQKQIYYVASLLDVNNMSLRMMRITSDLLPAYTHPDFKLHWQDKDLIDKIAKKLSVIGEYARNNDVRLSFHPGQYTVLNSVNHDIQQRAIKEIEYHTDMARWLGYANKEFHPHGFAINIHTGSKAGGIDNFINGFQQLSQDSKNLLTVENDEFSFGIEDVLQLKEYCPIVYDCHHDMIFINKDRYKKTNFGLFDRPTLKDKILDSWRGVTPKMHFSLTPKELSLEYNPSKLRKHSYNIYDPMKVIDIVNQMPEFDIMVEAKNKNKAAKEFVYRYSSANQSSLEGFHSKNNVPF